MNQTFENNKIILKKKFHNLSQEEIYKTLIDLGRDLDPLEQAEQILKNKVLGCQSQMYVKGYFDNGHIYFKMYSDALISSGIATIFQILFKKVTPEDILKSDINFLKDLGITSSLSQSRSNGLISLYMKIKQISLCFLTETQNTY